VRFALFYLTLLTSQGVLAVLLAPLPAPDFFLLAVMTLFWRLRAWHLVLAAYGVGLLQDVIGHGVLGVHALGLAGGVLAASFVRAHLGQAGTPERLVMVAAALVGKWLVFVVMLLWLNESSGMMTVLGRVALPESLLTLLLSPFILQVAEGLRSHRPAFSRETP
jgi:rod shape-determining protein MreD